jgi:saccharopine dehydrogenase (NAD+, L-lysine-forming)
MFKIYVRKEISKEELRVPLAPNDIPLLLNNGFIVYIESCNKRIFKDKEYSEKGAIVTLLKWYDTSFKDALIVGLKTLEGLEFLNGHKHVYFSHSYKKQTGYEIILNKFKESGSVLYDFEYFIDNNNKRLISFGYYAGIVGSLLGLLQFIEKKYYNRNLKNLKYLNHVLYIEKIDYIQKYNLEEIDIKICIIGYNGNCGKGVIDILDQFNLKYDKLDKLSDKSKLSEYDIIINCINLDENYNEIWLDKNTKFTKKILIVDISCDYNKANNPIKIYDQNTTWEDPVYSYNNMVDIIGINNLPSLIPENSSIYFSEKFVNLLLNFNKNKFWDNNKKIFIYNINKKKDG